MPTWPIQAEGRSARAPAPHPYNLSLDGLDHRPSGRGQGRRTGARHGGQFRAPQGRRYRSDQGGRHRRMWRHHPNTYYVARLFRSTKPEEQKLMEKIAVVWPDQAGNGVAHQRFRRRHAQYAPHKGKRPLFLNTWPPDQAQRYFADGNNEWPAVDKSRSATRPLNRSANSRPTSCR